MNVTEKNNHSFLSERSAEPVALVVFSQKNIKGVIKNEKPSVGTCTCQKCMRYYYVNFEI